MTSDEIRRVVLDAITAVAPEVDPVTVRPGVSFRDQIDLDSVDFLNVILAIHARLGLDIPEADYAKFTTLDSAVAYLAAKVAPART